MAAFMSPHVDIISRGSLTQGTLPYIQSCVFVASKMIKKIFTLK